MSQTISEYVNYTKERGERIERVVERYESADAVILHSCKTEMKDANMNSQHTGTNFQFNSIPVTFVS